MRFYFNIVKNYLIIIFFTLIKKNKIRIIVLTEHIGDIIACEPLSRQIKSEFPNAYVVWIINRKYKGLNYNNPHVNLYIEIDCLSSWIYLKKMIPPWITVFDLHIDKRICTERFLMLKNPNSIGISLENYYNFGNLLTAFCSAAGFYNIKDVTPIYYLKQYKLPVELPREYIVIHTTSNESSRNWDVNKWNTLINNLIRNTKYDFIELGFNKTINLNNCRYHFVHNSLSFDQIALIIKGAKLFIGIDSAFAHFANAVNTPGVILLGRYRMFEKYMPYSGDYKNLINSKIIQFDDQAKSIPVNLVERLVYQSLGKIY